MRARSDRLARLAPAFPALFLLVSTLFFSQFPFPFEQESLPLLPALAIIYYWALFRPSSLPLWVVAIIALLHDVLYGIPLGSSLSLFLSILAVCLWLRRRLMFEHFLLAWVMFMPMLLMAFLLLCYWQYWITGIPMGRWMTAYDLPFFLSWLSYPLFHLMLNWFYHQLSPE